MPIDIRCVQCGQLLRVPDTAAGKQVKCPSCGTIQTVPASPPASEDQPGSPFADGPSPSFGPPDANPYQAPQFGGTAQAPPAAARGPLQPTELDFDQVFGCTWRIFTNRFKPCMIVFFVGLAVTLPGQIVVQLLATIAERNADSNLSLIAMELGVVVSLIQTWIHIGQTSAMLRIARGQETTIREVFGGGKHFVRVIVASLLFTVIVAAGMLFLIVPGVILALVLCQFYCLIIDREMGVFEAFETSAQLMDGNKLILFGILALTAVVAPLLVVATCFVGLFFVAPFLSLMMVVIYLLVSGQPLAPEAKAWQPSSPFARNMGQDDHER